MLLQPLVENAIKYAVTPQEDGADITIRAQLAGTRVRIIVSDSGPGLQQGAVNPMTSTGVGMVNIRERLTQAYGDEHRFDTYTRPGEGFEAVIEFPYQVKSSGAEIWRTRSNCTATRHERRNSSRMSIRTILVDDERLATQGLEMRLEPFDDIEIVATCLNGREAIRKIKTLKPDLVFLDIQMPGFDGFSVVQGVMDIDPPLFVFARPIPNTPSVPLRRRPSTI